MEDIDSAFGAEVIAALHSQRRQVAADLVAGEADEVLALQVRQGQVLATEQA